MTRLTASGIDRARKCLHSFAPDAGPGNRASSAAAAKGNVEHGHIETTIDESADTSQDEDEKERAFIAETFGDSPPPEPRSETHRRWLNDWWAAERVNTWHAEQAFAINPFTGETRKGPDGWPSRDYVWAPDDFVPGTADVFGFSELPGFGLCLRVPDWKTGQASNLLPPGKSGQLHLLGLAISRHIGWRGPVSLEFVRVNEQRLWTERAVVTRADLLAFQAELAGLLRGALGSPEPVRGYWCKQHYCDQRGRCSATIGQVAATVPALVAREPFRVALTAAGFVSDEHAAWQYAALDVVDALAKEARQALKDRARARPVPIGGGKLYGEVEASNDTFKLDAPGFDAVLAKHLGKHAAEVVETKRIATKGRIEDAARAIAKERLAAGEKGERTVIKKINALVLLDLRGIGGLKASPYRKLDVYVPKVAAPAPVPLAEVMAEIGEALRVEREGNVA